MQKAAAYWSAKSVSGYAPNWFSLCAEDIQKRVTGQTSLGISRWVMQRYLPQLPARSMLEIGCLSGAKLRGFLDDGWIASGVGVDVAAGAIEDGRKILRYALDLRTMDLNDPKPLGQKFEVIHANGVLHHIEKLEACAAWLREHLAPGGILIASEFTGPVRYRYSSVEVALINEGVCMLPAELRFPFDPISLKPKLDADPSESIRSRDIPDVLKAAGLELDLMPYGGNVLQRALSPHFFRGFDPRSSDHAAALYRLVRFDEEVMRSSMSHHHVIVGRRAK